MSNFTTLPTYKDQPKHVFDTSMVAHVWAQQEYDNGRNSGNFFFHGPTIYSYRLSYPVATFVYGFSEPIAFVSADTYSSTTAKHIREAQYAVSGRTLNVPHDVLMVLERGTGSADARRWGAEKTVAIATAIANHYQGILDDSLGSASRARKYADSHIERAERAVFTANMVADLFEQLPRFKGRAAILKALRLSMPTNLEDTLVDVRRRAAEAREVLWREHHERAEARQRAELGRVTQGLDAVAAWRNGGESLRMWGTSGYDLMRVHNENVETSSGANVPIDHVTRALPLALALLRGAIRNQEPIHVPATDSARVGHFTINRAEPHPEHTAILVVGCHRFTLAEIMRLLTAMGDDAPARAVEIANTLGQSHNVAPESAIPARLLRPGVTYVPNYDPLLMRPAV